MRARISSKNILKKCLSEMMDFNFNKSIESIVIDSRKIRHNDIFLCLQGNKSHGSDFIDEEILRKVSYIITDSKTKGDKILNVDNSNLFLNNLATNFRKRLETKFIGITGTNGKTSTKEFLLQMLKTKFNVSCSRGNYNSLISMPLSVLECNENSDFCILEMGASKNGEIGKLCEIANPNYGVVTNISESHLKGYSNFNSLIKTKMQLFDYLSNNNGTFFQNLDDKNISVKNNDKLKSISFSILNENSDYFMKNNYNESKDNRKVLINDYEFVMPHHSKSFKYNFLCSYSIASHLGISNENIDKGLKEYDIPNGRGNIIKKNDYLIINDSYNANYKSMTQGIEDLKSITKGKYNANLFLSDMLELGEKSEFFHSKLGCFLSNLDFIDNIFLIGKRVVTTYDAIENRKVKKYYFEDLNSFFKNFRLKQIDKNSINYIKGSRSMHLNKIMEVFDVR